MIQRSSTRRRVRRAFRPHGGGLLAVGALCLLGAGVSGAGRQGGGAESPETVRIFAAASLTDVVTAVVRDFEAAHAGVSVELNFNATSTLVRQVLAGAACDVFLSADRRNTDRLVDGLPTPPATVREFVGNELVVVLAPGVAPLGSLEHLRDRRFRRLAICPPAVPVGGYSHQLLSRAGLLDSLRERFVLTDHTRAALSAVGEGVADAAFVYRTDSIRSRVPLETFRPAAKLQPEITCYAVLLPDADVKPEAARVFEALYSQSACEHYAAAGFVPPGGAPPVASQTPAATESTAATQMPETGESPATPGSRYSPPVREADYWAVLWRTLGIGLAATLVVTPIGVLLGYVLARRSFPGRGLLQGLLTLPLVLPPVAVGLLLLKLLSPRTPWGGIVSGIFGGEVVFTWKAAAIAAAVMGAPLLIRSAEAAFASVPPRYELLAASLGVRRLRIFWTVTLPLAARGVGYGVLLCFLRAIGEFGATTLVAGNIPGRTETLALAIYARTQEQRDEQALAFAGIAVAIAIAATVAGELLLRRRRGDAIREAGPA